jgi:hypothetical protein
VRREPISAIVRRSGVRLGINVISPRDFAPERKYDIPSTVIMRMLTREEGGPCGTTERGHSDFIVSGVLVNDQVAVVDCGVEARQRGQTAHPSRDVRF